MRERAEAWLVGCHRKNRRAIRRPCTKPAARGHRARRSREEDCSFFSACHPADIIGPRGATEANNIGHSTISLKTLGHRTKSGFPAIETIRGVHELRPKF